MQRNANRATVGAAGDPWAAGNFGLRRDPGVVTVL
jgi:hypothetical protein